MQRITITIDDDLMDDLDRVIAARGYQNADAPAHRHSHMHVHRKRR
jgi:hypothetical protein